MRDLARFDAALDSLLLLREDTLAAAWTGTIGRDKVLPTGLGWFVQKYNGETVVWQFGMMTNGYSSLILKLPARRLTLILLANSDGLSSPFDLPSGDVTKSLFAVPVPAPVWLRPLSCHARAGCWRSCRSHCCRALNRRVPTG